MQLLLYSYNVRQTEKTHNKLEINGNHLCESVALRVLLFIKALFKLLILSNKIIQQSEKVTH